MTKRIECSLHASQAVHASAMLSPLVARFDAYARATKFFKRYTLCGKQHR